MQSDLRMIDSRYIVYFLLSREIILRALKATIQVLNALRIEHFNDI